MQLQHSERQANMTIAIIIQLLQIITGVVAKVTSGGVQATAEEISAFEVIAQKMVQILADQRGVDMAIVLHGLHQVPTDVPTKDEGV